MPISTLICVDFFSGLYFFILTYWFVLIYTFIAKILKNKPPAFEEVKTDD